MPAAMPVNDELRKEFDALVKSHRDELVAIASRVLRNSAEAEDVVQETLLRVWLTWSTDRPRDVMAYLARAVTLNAIKRRQRRKPTMPLDESVAAAPAVAEEPPIDPLTLERAISTLPAPQQAVIRMRFYVGLSMAQIGRQLAISYNTAASRCRYALVGLKHGLTVRHGRTHHQQEQDHE